MNDIQEKMVIAVDAAGGSATWEQVMEDLNYQERQRALVEIRQLEADNVIKRVVRYDAASGQTLFTIEKVG